MREERRYKTRLEGKVGQSVVLRASQSPGLRSGKRDAKPEPVKMGLERERGRSIGWSLSRVSRGSWLRGAMESSAGTGFGDVAAPDPTDGGWNRPGNSSQAMLAQAIAPVDIDVKGPRKLVKASTTSNMSNKNKMEMSARRR